MDRLDWRALLNTLIGAVVVGVGIAIGLVIVAALLLPVYVAGGR